MLISIQELKTHHLPAYSERVIRRWAHDGVIPVVRISRKMLFDPIEVIAALKRWSDAARATS